MRTADIIHEIILGFERLIQNIRKLYNGIKNRNKIFKPESMKKM